LEHFVYCQRQWGLIHIERWFEDNEYTVRGHVAHDRVDRHGSSSRSGVRSERRMPVWSDRLGLHGYCDVVEFDDGRVVPVEYKSGGELHDAARVQLAAQAMCLEEMLDTCVDVGIVYLVSRNERREVAVSSELKARVTSTAAAIRVAFADGEVPGPTADVGRCRRCSLEERCMPDLVRTAADLVAGPESFDGIVP
jgi:CRISPR-associated exonuclease Cas4